MRCTDCGAVCPWNPTTEADLYGWWNEQHPVTEPCSVDFTETALGAAARTYAAAGWTVFPLWWPIGHRCACPAGVDCNSPGKHPIVRRGVHDASADPDRIAAWWRRWPEANIGLPVGANGLAVLDVDPAHGGGTSFIKLTTAMAEVGEAMPATLTQTTGSGGAHYIFSAPPEGVKNMSEAFGPDLPGLDTRGRGGYIVVAPSVHASGGIYQWVDFFTVEAPWPDILTELMNWRAPEPRATPHRPVTGAGYGEAALRGELERVRRAAESTRNTTLNEAAFALGQLVAAGHLDETRVRDELIEAGTAIGLTFTECVKTVNSGLRGGAQKPRRAA